MSLNVSGGIEHSINISREILFKDEHFPHISSLRHFSLNFRYFILRHFCFSLRLHFQPFYFRTFILERLVFGLCSSFLPQMFPQHFLSCLLPQNFLVSSAALTFLCFAFTSACVTIFLCFSRYLRRLLDIVGSNSFVSVLFQTLLFQYFLAHIFVSLLPQ